MNRNLKITIILIVIAAVAIIFAKPYLTKKKYDKFQVTPNAAVELDKSLQKKRPVFLEFYASW